MTALGLFLRICAAFAFFSNRSSEATASGDRSPRSAGFEEAYKTGDEMLMVARSLVSDRILLFIPAWVYVACLVLAAALTRVSEYLTSMHMAVQHLLSSIFCEFSSAAFLVSTLRYLPKAVLLCRVMQQDKTRQDLGWLLFVVKCLFDVLKDHCWANIGSLPLLVVDWCRVDGKERSLERSWNGTWNGATPHPPGRRQENLNLNLAVGRV